MSWPWKRLRREQSGGRAATAGLDDARFESRAGESTTSHLRALAELEADRRSGAGN